MLRILLLTVLAASSQQPQWERDVSDVLAGAVQHALELPGTQRSEGAIQRGGPFGFVIDTTTSWDRLRKSAVLPGETLPAALLGEIVGTRVSRAQAFSCPTDRLEADCRLREPVRVVQLLRLERRSDSVYEVEIAVHVPNAGLSLGTGGYDVVLRVSKDRSRRYRSFKVVTIRVS